MEERMERVKEIMAELDCSEDMAKEQFGIRKVMGELGCEMDVAEPIFYNDIEDKYHEDDTDVALQMYLTDSELWGESETKKDIVFDSDTCMEIQRGEVTNIAVKAVSDYVKELPLSTEDNDRLVGLLTSMLTVAEREQFVSGLKLGCSLGTAADN